MSLNARLCVTEGVLAKPVVVEWKTEVDGSAKKFGKHSVVCQQGRLSFGLPTILRKFVKRNMCEKDKEKLS